MALSIFLVMGYALPLSHRCALGDFCMWYKGSVNMCTHMQRPQADIRVFSVALHLMSGDKVSPWTRRSLFQLDCWPALGPPVSVPSSPLLCWGQGTVFPGLDCHLGVVDPNPGPRVARQTLYLLSRLLSLFHSVFCYCYCYCLCFVGLVWSRLAYYSLPGRTSQRLGSQVSSPCRACSVIFHCVSCSFCFRKT